MPTYTYTRYPDNYDTPGIVDDSKGLPIIVDMQTPVRAEVVNRHREAILAIEGELGLQPSGTYDTVRARLDALDGVLGSLNANPVNILIDGVQVIAGVTDLNFVGDGVSVVSSGGHGVTVSITGGGGGTGTGSDPEHEQLPVTYNGQTSFTLANAPSDGILLLFISGIKQQISDYTVVGQYLTWTGPQTLLTSDVVEVLYFLVGGSGGGGGGSVATTTSMRQEIFTATNGQSVYVLQGSPINQQATEFFIDGVSQAVGIDYTVSGAVVTYIGDVTIIAGNEISIKYFETISSASAASNSTMHQTTFTATEGQVVYVLPYLPISEQSTEFFINGVSQTVVSDYTLDGYTVTYIGDVAIVAGNIISIKYFELLSFSNVVIQLEKSGTIYNVNKITCDDSIDVVISGTEAVLTAKVSDFCIGDLSVASEIVNPATPLILAHLGDSRTSILTDSILQSYAPNLQWSGAGFGYSAYPQTWMSSVVYGQGALTPVTTPFGYLGTRTPIQMDIHTLNGGTTGASSQFSQYFYSTYIPGPYALYQLSGRVLRYYMLLLEGPHGVTTTDLRLVIDWVGGTYTSSYFSTYATTVGVKVVYVDVPSTHNWTTYGSLYPKLEHRYNTVTTNGQQVVTVGTAFVPVDAGICRINCGVGSRQSGSFSDETIFSGDLWPDYFAKFGSNCGLWIDLGTNGSGNLDTAPTDTAHKILIANRFREQFPNGPILFTTAYPGGSGGVAGELPGCSKGWRDGAIAAAAAIPHSLVVDTYNAMPTAAQALALTYYAGGDYIHYSTLGSQALAAVISEVLRKAASRNA